MAARDGKEKEEEKTSSFTSFNGADNYSNASTVLSDLSDPIVTNSEDDYVGLKQREEACSVCIKKGKIRAATHFCKYCGDYGKYICNVCLKHHSDFLSHHKVISLSVTKESKRKSKPNKLDRSIREGSTTDYTKSWLYEQPHQSARSDYEDDDSSYSKLESSTMSSSSKTTSAKESMIAGSLTTLPETVISQSSLNISNMEMYDKKSTSSFDSILTITEDLVNSGRIEKTDTGIKNVSHQLALPDTNNLRQNFIRRKECWQDGVMQQNDSARFENIIYTRKGQITNSDSNSSARAEDALDHKTVTRVNSYLGYDEIYDGGEKQDDKIQKLRDRTRVASHVSYDGINEEGDEQNDRRQDNKVMRNRNVQINEETARKTVSSHAADTLTRVDYYEITEEGDKQDDRRQDTVVFRERKGRCNEETSRKTVSSNDTFRVTSSGEYTKIKRDKEGNIQGDGDEAYSALVFSSTKARARDVDDVAHFINNP